MVDRFREVVLYIYNFPPKILKCLDYATISNNLLQRKFKKKDHLTMTNVQSLFAAPTHQARPDMGHSKARPGYDGKRRLLSQAPTFIAGRCLLCQITKFQSNLPTHSLQGSPTPQLNSLIIIHSMTIQTTVGKYLYCITSYVDII